MNGHHVATPKHPSLVRRLARLSAVAAPVVGLAILGAGMAPADESPVSPPALPVVPVAAPVSATQPIDAFADHWQQYHYGKDITTEPQVIMADPQGYAAIHQEMAEHMLGKPPVEKAPVAPVAPPVAPPVAAPVAPPVAAPVSATQPIDAFADHWQQYHYGKDITTEPQVIMADPQGYAAIHQEMAEHMLGH